MLEIFASAPICASVKSSPAETTSTDTVRWFSAKLPTAHAVSSNLTLCRIAPSLSTNRCADA